MKLKSKYIQFCNKIFLKYIRKKDLFRSFRKDFLSARLNILFESYISVMLFTTILTFAISLILVLFFLFYFIKSLKYPYIFLLLIPFFVAIIVFSIFYVYPKYVASKLKNSIEENLPLASLYMYAISQANLTPEKIFEIISKKEEFGGLAKEFKYLVYSMKVLGLDLLSAVINLIKTTSSDKLRAFLHSFIQVYKSEGDLKQFLYTYSRNVLLDYKLKLKSYEEKLSLLMTAYTALFVSFPLIMIVLLSIFAILLSNVELLRILIYGIIGLLPLAHIIFIYLMEILKS